LTELNEELKVDPASAEAEYEIAEVYRKHGQLDPAVSAFQRALQRNPTAVPVRLGMAKALLQLGRKQEALTALEPSRNSDDPTIHFFLAQIFRELGRRAEADKETAAFQRLQKAQQPLESHPSPRP
jgi:predicted Zn-dependent protease